MSVENAKSFRDAVSSIANLVGEGVFEATPEGLRLKAIDPSQISMVSFFMPSSAFSMYDASKKEKKESFGVDIEKLIKVLDRARPDEKLVVSLEKNEMVVEFVGGKRKRTFRMPLLDLGEGVQKEPPISYKNYIKMNDSLLKESIKDAKLISSHLRFLISDGVLRLEVAGENSRMVSEYEEGEEVLEMKAEGNVRATFPLNYLDDIVKGSSAGSIITLYLETDSPLKVTYEVGGATVVYYLAPRMEVE